MFDLKYNKDQPLTDRGQKLQLEELERKYNRRVNHSSIPAIVGFSITCLGAAPMGDTSKSDDAPTKTQSDITSSALKS